MSAPAAAPGRARILVVDDELGPRESLRMLLKGTYEVRAEDHALLQPMFQTKLSGSGDNLTAELVETLSPEDVAPPPTPFAGQGAT